MLDRKDVREIARNGIIGLLFGLALLVVGGLLAWRFHTVWYAWPRVEATVTGGTIEESYQYPTARTAIHLFRLGIDLRYTLNDKTYTTRAWVDSGTDSYAKAQNTLRAEYAPGTRHAIRYNPNDAADIRFGPVQFGMLALSLSLLLLGFVLLGTGMKARPVAYSREHVAGAPRLWRRAKIAGQGVEFRPSAPTSSDAVAGIRCPYCGQKMEAGESTCPNCLKSIRAA